MCFGKYIEWCNHHHGHNIDYIFLPWKSSLMRLRYQFYPLATTNLFSAAIALPLIEIHVKEVMQHVGFLSESFTWHNACDYHPCRCVSNSFLFIARYCPIVYMCHTSIHPYSSWWTGCFQLLQFSFQFEFITNKAAFEKTFCVCEFFTLVNTKD